MAQIVGIVRYEMLMGWRRGSSRLMFFVPVLMPILGFVLFTSNAFTEEQLASSQLSAELARQMSTAMALTDNLFLIPILMFLVPVMVAEVIPLDRQYKMYETLRALPISAGTYLTGKVLSVVLQVVASTLTAGLISFGLQSLRAGSIDAAPVLLFWLGGVLALALFASIAGVLIPALQPDRRRAVLLGWAVALITVGVYVLLPIHEVLMIALIKTAALTADAPISASALPSYPSLFQGNYLRNYQILIAVLALLWAFIAWRLRHSEPAR